MNSRRILGGYGIVVGLSMIGLWAVLLVEGQVPELQTARLQLAYHLAAELLTALALLVTSVGMVSGHVWAGRGYLVALGMLLYTVINSAGYYAELGEIAMVGPFACLTVTTLGCLWIGLTHPRVLSINRV